MKRLLPAVLFGILLAACTNQNWEPVSVAPGSDTALASFVAAKKDLARKLEQEGKLVEALREWRYVTAADPKDEESRQHVADLGETIEARKTAYLKEGDAALAKGQTRQAQVAFLKLLALDPSDKAAVERLRKIDRTIALANQNKKDDRAMADYRATVARDQDTSEEFEAKLNVPLKNRDYRKVIDVSDQFLKRNPNNKLATSYRKSAYLGLVDESQAKGHYRDALTYLDTASEMVTDDSEKHAIEEKRKVLKGQLASKLYSQGLGVMNTNLPKAIDFLAEAVSLDPDNWRFRQSLNQARKMQENLDKIGKGGN